MSNIIFETAKSTDLANKMVSDKYSFVLVTAKRARSIKSGARPLLEEKFTKKLKPVQIAINEIAKRSLNSENFNMSDISTSENIVSIASVGMINKIPQQKIGKRSNDFNKISYQDMDQEGDF